MRKIFLIFLTMSTLFCQAQDRRVQNKPYTDLRTFHFGVLVGTHLQDVEFNNVGPQLITLDDGMDAFKSHTNLVSPQSEDNNIRYIIIDYFRDKMAKGQDVDTQLEGRVVIQK